MFDRVTARSPAAIGIVVLVLASSSDCGLSDSAGSSRK